MTNNTQQNIIKNDTNIETYINKYPNITFTYSDDLDFSDFHVVNTLDELVKHAQSNRKLEYTLVNKKDDEATNYIKKIIISMYVKGVSATLDEAYRAEPKDMIDRNAFEFQLSILKSIGDCLMTQESTEATMLTDKCKCTYFDQLIIFNRYTGEVIFLENTDKAVDEFQEAITLTDNIFTTTMLAMNQEYQEELKESVESNENLVC